MELPHALKIIPLGVPLSTKLKLYRQKEKTLCLLIVRSLRERMVFFL